MSNWIVRTLFAGIVASVLVSPTDAQPELSVRLSANIAMAPADVLVIAHVAPDRRNRGLTIAADSGDYYSSTYLQLDGASDAAIQQVWFKSLPGGSYDVTARLEGASGVIAKAETRLQVLRRAGG